MPQSCSLPTSYFFPYWPESSPWRGLLVVRHLQMQKIGLSSLWRLSSTGSSSGAVQGRTLNSGWSSLRRWSWTGPGPAPGRGSGAVPGRGCALVRIRVPFQSLEN